MPEVYGPRMKLKIISVKLFWYVTPPWNKFAKVAVIHLQYSHIFAYETQRNAATSPSLDWMGWSLQERTEVMVHRVHRNLEMWLLKTKSIDSAPSNLTKNKATHSNTLTNEGDISEAHSYVSIFFYRNPTKLISGSLLLGFYSTKEGYILYLCPWCLIKC